MFKVLILNTLPWPHCLRFSLCKQLADRVLFSLQGVDESTHFAPHVRCEIGAFAWHLIEHLPSTWEQGKQASRAQQPQCRLAPSMPQPRCRSLRAGTPSLLVAIVGRGHYWQ